MFGHGSGLFGVVALALLLQQVAPVLLQHVPDRPALRTTDERPQVGGQHRLAQGGAGLGTMWGEELALEMLNAAGFEAIDVHQLEHDFQNNFYVMRKNA